MDLNDVGVLQCFKVFCFRQCAGAGVFPRVFSLIALEETFAGDLTVHRIVKKMHFAKGAVTDRTNASQAGHVIRCCHSSHRGKQENCCFAAALTKPVTAKVLCDESIVLDVVVDFP